MALFLVFDQAGTYFSVDSNNVNNADGYSLFGSGNGLDSPTTRDANNHLGGAYFRNTVAGVDVPEPSMTLIVAVAAVGTGGAGTQAAE